MKIKKSTIIIIAALVTIVLLFVFVKPLNNWLKNAVASFKSIDSVKAYIQSFGVWAVAASFLLMILQSVAAPIPAFFVTFANALVWGWKWGALLSWTSAMAGAILCFYIARIYGRNVTEKFVTASALKTIDAFFVKYGKNAILAARLLPFVPFCTCDWHRAASSNNRIFVCRRENIKSVYICKRLVADVRNCCIGVFYKNYLDRKK